DVVAVDELGKPQFWGEAGQITVQKIRSLLRRYRATHVAIAKWETPLKPYIEIVTEALDGLKRERPVDLINFQENSVRRFIDENGRITIEHDSLNWVRLE
ncbi:MAG: hypothetical protein PVF10_10485, partial [Syntrophobacterales bacterium]